MRMLVLLLLAFTSITAFGGGILLMMEPEGSMIQLSPALLKDSPFPFPDYFIPGLVLCFVVGGTNLLAALYTVLRKPPGIKLSLLSGVMVLGFIVVEIIVIREFSWLQLLYLVIGLAIITATLKRMKKQ